MPKRWCLTRNGYVEPDQRIVPSPLRYTVAPIAKPFPKKILCSYRDTRAGRSQKKFTGAVQGILVLRLDHIYDSVVDSDGRNSHVVEVAHRNIVQKIRP